MDRTNKLVYFDHEPRRDHMSLIRQRTTPRKWSPPAEDRGFSELLESCRWSGPFAIGYAPWPGWYWNAGCLWENDHTYCDYSPRNDLPPILTWSEFMSANYRRGRRAKK